MSTEIFITREGQQYGPYEEDAVRDMLQTGQICPGDMAWREGMEEWKPLGQLLGVAAPPPPPMAASAPTRRQEEHVFFHENGVLVTNKRLVIGSQTFPLHNIGSVSIGEIKVSRFWPMLGFFFFGVCTLAGFMSATVPGQDANSAGVGWVMALSFLVVTIWCAKRAFALNHYCLELAAAGGVQKAYPTRDAKFLQAVAESLNNALVEQR